MADNSNTPVMTPERPPEADVETYAPCSAGAFPPLRSPRRIMIAFGSLSFRSPPRDGFLVLFLAFGWVALPTLKSTFRIVTLYVKQRRSRDDGRNGREVKRFLRRVDRHRRVGRIGLPRVVGGRVGVRVRCICVLSGLRGRREEVGKVRRRRGLRKWRWSWSREATASRFSRLCVTIELRYRLANEVDCASSKPSSFPRQCHRRTTIALL